MADASASDPQTFGRLDPETALAALCSMGDAVACTDVAGRITFLNAVAEKLSGWTLHEAIGRPVTEILNLFDEAVIVAAHNPVGECLRLNDSYVRESGLILLARSGGAYDIGMSAAPIRLSADKIVGCVILFNNVTEIRAHEKRLAHSALHDPLTGLPNRASLMASLREAVTQAQEEGRTHFLCFVDLDRFKCVNDRGGHAAGDALLAGIARLIARTSAGKGMVARLGGDEFALLLHDCAAHDVEKIANSIIHAIRSFAFHWEGQVFRVGASIGAAAITRNTPDLSEILHQADKACYAAKESGRNRLCIYKQSHRSALQARSVDVDEPALPGMNVH